MRWLWSPVLCHHIVSEQECTYHCIQVGREGRDCDRRRGNDVKLLPQCTSMHVEERWMSVVPILRFSGGHRVWLGDSALSSALPDPKVCIL